MGTPTQMYDEEGEQVWERSLDLNGKVINGSNAPCPFLYQGQYYDKEIELAYNRFRYYNPDDGRYISQDPIGLLSGEYGFYNYVGDTNSWVDPFGLAKSYADPNKNKKTSHNSDSKRAAFRQAKRDAGIPMNQQPFKRSRVDLTEKKNGIAHKIYDDKGMPIKVRQNHFRQSDGKEIIIQEHSIGHTNANPNHGKEPHFNVRPSTNPETGSVDYTHGHYNFKN
ncbi:HNH/endonuclease VII fold putative polymorphic toxin [Tenacibaculum maritimum]|uniref:HNH/endonuclease VII fold putative polymorphic toxin n=1 Tax=Tenacibaculum maritimum TaxID=107401 RepID=UPI00387654BF